MPRDFFLEVGCEEIPARALPPALEELKTKLKTRLEDEDLAFTGIEALGSARRLVVRVTHLEERQPDRKVQTLGPPESIAFADGAPSRALLGFQKKSGIPMDELQIFETDRGRYMGFEKNLEGKTATDILTSEVPDVIRSLYFPKTMYWTTMSERFARPVRWVLAMYGDDHVPLELFGIRSSAVSQGHRILGSQSISVTDFDDYLEKLERNGVLVSQGRRQQKVETELAAAAASIEGLVVPDAHLLEEVTYINEYPTVVMGAFATRFLDLPREVLITVMRVHQKYFAVENAEGGLLGHFLAVANTRSDPDGLIRKGHERVLEARLSDALFFWEVDSKSNLEERSSQLDSVVFRKELGTYRDKAARMEPLALEINEATSSGVDRDIVRRIVRWAKADLLTDLVGEFPDMQGVVGGLYARREGAPSEVWKALYDQYRPAGLEDRSPETPAGCVLALADRLDTVISCFSIGIVPTGSEDPFGVRRQTQGIIKILLDHQLHLPLNDILDRDGRLEGASRDAFQKFYTDRLRYILGRMGFEYDEINAVLLVGADDPTDARNRAEALREVRQSPDMAPLATAFKRIKNILKQAGTLEEVTLDRSGNDIEAEERELARLIAEMEPQVRTWTRQSEYAAVLEAMASLRSPIDAFFTKIMVMHEDAAVRQRRLQLLDRLFQMFSGVADISEVVVSE